MYERTGNQQYLNWAVQVSLFLLICLLFLLSFILLFLTSNLSGSPFGQQTWSHHPMRLQITMDRRERGCGGNSRTTVVLWWVLPWNYSKQPKTPSISSCHLFVVVFFLVYSSFVKVYIDFVKISFTCPQLCVVYADQHDSDFEVSQSYYLSFSFFFFPSSIISSRH